jgi:hemerythrin
MLEIIKWSDEFSVGIHHIDSQHKTLFASLNDFYNGITENKSKEAVEELLLKLKDYSVFHFSSEENLMKQYNFPGYKSHKLEHDNFVQKVNDYESRFLSGKLLLTIEITNFIKDWIQHHILSTDMQYKAFFNEIGLK